MSPDNKETFIRLVSLIRDDRALNSAFIQISQKDQPARTRILAGLLQKMKDVNAPPDHIAAMKTLQNEEAFLKVMREIS